MNYSELLNAVDSICTVSFVNFTINVIVSLFLFRKPRKYIPINGIKDTILISINLSHICIHIYLLISHIYNDNIKSQ